jgi:ferric-dicitrate binding protein FerR (iron transport regulator)
MSREKIWHLFARKLAEEASHEELLELDQLVEKDAFLLYELQELERFWELDQRTDEEYMEATYLLHRNRMADLGLHPGEPVPIEEGSLTGPISFFARHKVKWAGAMVVLLVVVGLFMVFQTGPGKLPVTAEVPQKQKEIATGKGAKTFVQLPDGSTVWLNAGSKLKYSPMGGDGLREVYLTGEGFFDVAKDPRRPFIIHTQSVDIKVHGTQFNVKAYPGDKTVETSLIHGSVEVLVKNRPGESYMLKPNQKLVLSLNVPNFKAQDAPTSVPSHTPVISLKNLTYQPGDTVAVETSWVQNRLVFEDEPFSDVALKMERWFDVEFEFQRKQIEDEHLRGSFEKETLDQALKALQFISTTKFKYKIENRKVIVY